jgi:uncharacterized membrane protein YvbJ
MELTNNQTNNQPGGYAPHSTKGKKMPKNKHIQEIGIARPSDKENLKQVIGDFMRIEYRLFNKRDSKEFNELTKKLLVLFQGLYVNSEDENPFPIVVEEQIVVDSKHHQIQEAMRQCHSTPEFWTGE